MPHPAAPPLHNAMIHCNLQEAGGRCSAVRAATDLPAGLLLGVCPASLALHLGIHCTDDLRSPDVVFQVRYQNGAVKGWCGEGPLSSGPPSSAAATSPGSHCSPSDWLMAMQPARDMHEQNVEVSTPDPHSSVVRLQTVRRVPQGHTLMVWFSDTLASLHQVPVLSPANIRGDQQYSCTHCPATYRHPNVLKAHIKYHCQAAGRERPSDMRPPAMLLAPAAQPFLLPPLHRHLAAKRDSLSPPAGTPAAPAFKTHLSPAMRNGETSAFRPIDASFARRLSPESASRRTPSSSASSSTSSPSSPKRERPSMDCHPVDLSLPPQTLGHHGMPPLTPPFALPPDHPALKLYYPLYGQVPSAGHLCYPNPLSPQPGYLPNYIHPYHPALMPYRMHRLLPQNDSKIISTPMKGSHETEAPNGATGPFMFPLPSEKEGEPLDLLPRSLYMSKSRKGHLCIYCGKLYSRKYGLKIHLRTHTGYKPLKCKVCLRPFGDPSNLNKHIRLHSEGDTPYRCEFCGKVLVRRRDLERHIKSRHPDTLTHNANDVTSSNDTGSETDVTDPKDEDMDNDLEHDLEHDLDIDIEDDDDLEIEVT